MILQLTELTGASLDQQVYHFSYKIIDKYSKTIFEKNPVYKENFFTKEFLRSDVIIDCNDNYEIGSSRLGYCIRTGTKIPFDIKKPYCAEAYKSWLKFGKLNYTEKFCHYSGEPSNGETSMARPVLKKNWGLV
jgi:hypothetical protein